MKTEEEKKMDKKKAKKSTSRNCYHGYNKYKIVARDSSGFLVLDTRISVRPFVRPSGLYYPPWILKRAGLESSGRIVSS